MTFDDMDFTDPKTLRKKAEEKLKEIKISAEKAEQEADVKRLVHELQVHQIELEMQNDELRQAYDTAEAALKKYTMLYDFSPIGYFTINHDGRIIDLNFSGAEILGEKRFSLTNSNFKMFLHEDSKDLFNDFLKKVYSSNVKESCQVKLDLDKNVSCSVYIEGVVTGDNHQCFLSVINISKLLK
jgi:PAS domain S-box-containing protein